MDHKRALGRFTTLALVSTAFAIPAAQADNGSGGGSGQPDTKGAAEVRLVWFGHGRCGGDLKIFVLIANGHRSVPMC
jgi:hypothetical protein